MQRTFLTIAIIAAALAVVLGAFGAHSLRERLTSEQLLVFETGVRYQFYHAFALIIMVLLGDKISVSGMNYTGWFFSAGILLFSGSLYLLSMRNLLGIENWKFLGPVTPLGGLCFIAGWISLLVSILKK